MTGPECAYLKWKRAPTDDAKFSVFDQHESYYAGFKGELKIWLAANWRRWDEEKPAWFTQAAIATIPTDILPEEELAKYGGGRRESKVGWVEVGRRLSVSK